MPTAQAATSTTPLDRALRSVALGEPHHWHGLTVFPLVCAEETPPAYDSFGAALAAGTFRVTEVSDSGIVAQLRAINEGSRPVLLLDGEEVVGAKQNRVINVTIIVPAKATIDIPVSCVEQGRWQAQSQAFRESGRAMFASGRARKARDVTDSLRTSGYAGADQGAVWDDVALKLDGMKVQSGTRAIGDAYDAHATRLNDYTKAFPPGPGQRGAVYALAGNVVGLELFDSSAAFAAAAPKLIQSYAFELLGGESATAEPSRDDAAKLVDEVARVSATEHAAPGAGRHVRFDDGHLVGGGLVLDGRLIHLFGFRTASLLDDPRGGRGHRAAPARRGRSDELASRLIRDGTMRCRDGAIFGSPPRTLDVPSAVLRDRINGMLIGLAVGDALGNATESQTPNDRRARFGEIRDYLPNRHAGGERVGLPSDDTQLAFRTVRRLVEDGELVPELLARDFAHGRIFGIGGTVRAFIRAFKDQGQPWHEAGQHSAGNGALMRIAPVVLPHLRAPSTRLWSDAAVAGMITHNEPASIGACVAFTHLLWALLGRRTRPRRGWWLRTFVATLRDVEGDEARYAPRTPHLRGESTLWAFTDRQVGAALERGDDVRTACDLWYSGAYLLETVPSVLYILERHAHDPEEAIVRAVNDTKDNDTVAAIVGAAVGAMHGLGGLPERWVRGLLGRTGEEDHGEVFRLVRRAGERFVGAEADELSDGEQRANRNRRRPLSP